MSTLKSGLVMKAGRLILPTLFLLGFLAGVSCIILGKEGLLSELLAFQPQFMLKIEQMIVNKRALFFLVLGKRLRAFFLLWLFSYSALKQLTTFAFFSYSGFCTGLVMEILAVQYGLRGILFYVGMICPQGIFYAVGYFLLGTLCLSRGRKEEGMAMTAKRGRKSFFLPSLGLVLIGCLLEAYINPAIIKFFAAVAL